MALPRLEIENGTLIFKNFSGKQHDYNAEGNRNFKVIIPSDVATELEKAGWTVSWLDPREPGDDPVAAIKVHVSYRFREPQIWMLTQKDGEIIGKTILHEDTVGILDFADIEKAELRVDQRPYQVGKRSGISGYLYDMYVTIREDRFASRYNDVPTIGQEPVNEPEPTEDEVPFY